MDEVKTGISRMTIDKFKKLSAAQLRKIDEPLIVQNRKGEPLVALLPYGQWLHREEILRAAYQWAVSGRATFES